MKDRVSWKDLLVFVAWSECWFRGWISQAENKENIIRGPAVEFPPIYFSNYKSDTDLSSKTPKGRQISFLVGE
jgi:hypothetical protein